LHKMKIYCLFAGSRMDIIKKTHVARVAGL
jgi:hypothetical protein